MTTALNSTTGSKAADGIYYTPSLSNTVYPHLVPQIICLFLHIGVAQTFIHEGIWALVFCPVRAYRIVPCTFALAWNNMKYRWWPPRGSIHTLHCFHCVAPHYFLLIVRLNLHNPQCNSFISLSISGVRRLKLQGSPLFHWNHWCISWW